MVCSGSSSRRSNSSRNRSQCRGLQNYRLVLGRKRRLLLLMMMVMLLRLQMVMVMMMVVVTTEFSPYSFSVPSGFLRFVALFALL